MTETTNRNSGIKTYAHMENYDYHIVDSRATPIVDNHYKVAIPRIVHQVLAPATLGYKNPRWRYQTAHL
jgi:hypothetical protein